MIKIPLTLAIVSALIVECCGERFAIPQISVIELVRATAASRNAIEYIKGAPVLRLRDRLLPLVSPCDGCWIWSEAESDRDTTPIIVVTPGRRTSPSASSSTAFSIPRKSWSSRWRRSCATIPMFSGNTILGDGSVIMILDPNGIAHACGEISVRGSRDRREQAHREPGVRNGFPCGVPLRGRRAESRAHGVGFAAGGNRPGPCRIRRRPPGDPIPRRPHVAAQLRRGAAICRAKAGGRSSW